MWIEIPVLLLQAAKADAIGGPISEVLLATPSQSRTSQILLLFFVALVVVGSTGRESRTVTKAGSNRAKKKREIVEPHNWGEGGKDVQENKIGSLKLDLWTLGCWKC